MSTNIAPYIGENSPLNKITAFFSALQSSAEEYLFVVDLESKMILLSDNFMKDFDFPSNIVDDLDNLLMPFIYHEDREIFEEAMRNILTEDKGKTVKYEFRLLHSNGDYGWVSLNMTIGGDEFNDQPEILCGVIKRLDEIAKADYITGLLRRSVFYDDLTKELETPNAHGAVIVIALDNFNVITETYGHKFGDGALRQIAQNITNVLPPDIRLYKLDGYSFGLFMPDAMPEELEIIFASVQLCMREIRNVEDTIYCTASAGAALYPNDAEEL